MVKVIKAFEQQAWHPQMSVNISEDNSVTIDGSDISVREQALVNIILRLNAGMKILMKNFEDEKEKVKQLEEKTSKIPKIPESSEASSISYFTEEELAAARESLKALKELESNSEKVEEKIWPTKRYVGSKKRPSIY